MPPTVPGAFPFGGSRIYMKMKHETQIQFDEPVGIVISRGWEPETLPRFSAYMWAPAPDDETEQDVEPA